MDLYLFQNKNKELIKVGISKDSKKRLKQLNSSITENYFEKILVFNNFTEHEAVLIENFIHCFLISNNLSIINCDHNDDFINNIISNKVGGYTEIFLTDNKKIQSVFLLLDYLKILKIEQKEFNLINDLQQSNITKNSNHEKKFNQIVIDAFNNNLNKENIFFNKDNQCYININEKSYNLEHISYTEYTKLNKNLNYFNNFKELINNNIPSFKKHNISENKLNKKQFQIKEYEDFKVIESEYLKTMFYDIINNYNLFENCNFYYGIDILINEFNLDVEKIHNYSSLEREIHKFFKGEGIMEYRDILIKPHYIKFKNFYKSKNKKIKNFNLFNKDLDKKCIFYNYEKLAKLLLSTGRKNDFERSELLSSINFSNTIIKILIKSKNKKEEVFQIYSFLDDFSNLIPDIDSKCWDFESLNNIYKKSMKNSLYEELINSILLSDLKSKNMNEVGKVGFLKYFELEHLKYEYNKCFKIINNIPNNKL